MGADGAGVGAGLAGAGAGGRSNKKTRRIASPGFKFLAPRVGFEPTTR